MHDMAKRDRNHPSVIINSLCNEYECQNSPGVGAAFVAASKAVDPTRLTTANSNSDDGLSAVIDVQVRSFLCLALDFFFRVCLCVWRLRAIELVMNWIPCRVTLTHPMRLS